MDKKAYLAELLGSEEKAEAYLQKTGLKQDALNAAGIESKEKEKPAPEPKPVEQVKTVVNNAVAANPGNTQAVVEAVMKALDIEGLNDFVLKAKPALEKVEVLEGLVKDLQGHTEEKLADMIRPPAGKFAWMKEARASQDDSTKVQADDPLTKKTPGLGDNWLSEVTHTEPVEVESVR